MTAHKHLKQLVRARMLKTGEGYASARRQVMRQAPATPPDPAARWHFPGNTPAATALRVLLTRAGLRAPGTGQPCSEAMVFGVAGGIGAGVFSFSYKQEGFASFHLAGRHNWQDTLGYLRDACRRFGTEPVIREAGGARAAEGQLREALAGGPCVAWVDMAGLPHRALPAIYSGGAYHVVTVYRVDEDSGTALIGDLADDPIPIPLDDLARARGRIKKDRYRLLAVPDAPGPRDVRSLVREGLKNCHDGRPGIGGRVMVNFTLDAFRVWGDRMHGSSDKESWEKVFPRGGLLWSGLTSIHDCIEHHGTGGGLCRPIFADFLAEAASATGADALRAAAERYEDLGRRWSDLAEAALPDDVPLFREAKQLLARKAELSHAGGGAAVEEIGQTWKRLSELAARARDEFPLTEAECRDLRAALQTRILSIYEAELAGHAALGALASSL
jgi:hypothetical protein